MSASTRKPCDLFSEEIHLLVDGELGVAESAVVEEHLQTCPHCLALAARLEAMSSMLKAWDNEKNALPAPALRLRHSVLARVAEHSVRRRRESRLVGLLHYATAALVLIALGAGVTLGLQQNVPAPSGPGLEISTATWPFDAVRAEGLDFPARETGPELAARSLAVMAPAATFAPLSSPGAEPNWDRDGTWRSVWEDAAGRGKLAFFAERVQREDALAERLDAPVKRWPGPRIDEPGQRLVTVSALNFLHDKGYLAEWKRATPAPGEAARPTVVAVRAEDKRTTIDDMTAAEMLSPMAGVDRELNALYQSGRLSAFAVVPPSVVRAGSKKRVANPTPLLEAWPLQLESAGAASSGFASGPIQAGLRHFLDPLKAEANKKLRLREEDDEEGSLVFIVEGTTEPIFLPAGQFVTGGLGTRVIAESVWLPASKGKTPRIVRCRMVQSRSYSEAKGHPTLVPYLAGPTIRALLAADASQAVVKAAASRIYALWQHPSYDLFSGWDLLDVYAGAVGKAQSEALRNEMRWKRGRGGFVVRDAGGRLVGIESVRFEGPAAEELLARLWIGYVAEALLREGRLHPENPAHGRDPATVHAALAPSSDELTQAFHRIANHAGRFSLPLGFDPSQGWRVSSLELVAAGLHFHALEVAGRPMVVSVVSGLQPAK